MAWFDEHLMITIISFGRLCEKCRIQCDNWNGPSFQVQAEVGIMRFKKSAEGLHCHEFSEDHMTSTREEHHFMCTAEKNEEGHTKDQQECAKTAQKPCHIIGAPTVENFKCLLRATN